MRNCPGIYLANLAKDGLVVQLGVFNERIGLIDSFRQHRVELGAVLAQFYRVVDGVLNLRNHVLSALVLEVAEVVIERVENVDGVDEGDVLLRLRDLFHQIRVPAHVLNLL